MPISRSLATVAVAATAAVLAPGTTAAAQTAEAIMDTALQRYESRMEGIRTYRVRRTVSGVTTTSRFVKRTVDGRPVFVRAGRQRRGPGVPAGWGNPYRLFPLLADRAALAGRTRFDGRPVWHVVVSDFGGLRLEGMTPLRAGGRFRPQRLDLLLDTGSHVLRRLRLQGKMVTDSGSRPLAVEAEFGDYREVQGMLHPFRLTLTVRGITATMPEADLRRLRRRHERLRRRLERLSDGQPERRRILQARLEQLRRMTESGEFRTEVVVREVEVDPEPGAGGGPS